MKRELKLLTKIAMFIAICFMQMDLYGQTDTTAKNKSGSFSQFIHRDRVALKFNYFGELVLHPGMTVGVDYTLKRTNRFTVHWDVDLCGYWHRWNHSALFVQSTIGSRIAMGSAFADLNAGIGYMNTSASGDMYQRAADGGVEKAKKTRHSHFKANTSLLFGWDGTRKANKPWTVSVGPEVYLQSSTNHIFLPHVAAKLGVTYKLKS